jgi:hypothetical protein
LAVIYIYMMCVCEMVCYNYTNIKKTETITIRTGNHIQSTVNVI